MSLLKQNHVFYGLLMCAFMATCLMLMYISNDYSKMNQPSLYNFIISFGAPLVIYTLGLRAKKKLLGGKLTFKQGLTEGFKISVVVGLVSPFVFLAFYTFFNPSLIEYARQAYQMTGSSDTVVVAVDLLVQLVGSIIGGTVYGAIVAFFLKTKS